MINDTLCCTDHLCWFFFPFKTKRLYNPRLLSTACGLVPFSIWIIINRFAVMNWLDLALGLTWIVFNYWFGFRSSVYRHFGSSISLLQKTLIASFMSLLVHQFEEYIIPGGAPVVINRTFYNNQKNYDRYPGNWNSIMIVNVSAYFLLTGNFLSRMDMAWLPCYSTSLNF